MDVEARLPPVDHSVTERSKPYFGAHGDEEIPVLIPNTEVKLISGDYTATSGKLARCRIIKKTSEQEVFFRFARQADEIALSPSGVVSHDSIFGVCGDLYYNRGMRHRLRWIIGIAAGIAGVYAVYLGILAPYKITVTAPSLGGQSGYVDAVLAVYRSSDMIADSTQVTWLADQPVDASGVMHVAMSQYMTHQGNATTRLRICTVSWKSSTPDGLSDSTRGTLESCVRTGVTDRSTALTSCEVVYLHGGLKGYLDLVGAPLVAQSQAKLDCTESKSIQ